jgi:HEAT repeat protein
VSRIRNRSRQDSRTEALQRLATLRKRGASGRRLIVAVGEALSDPNPLVRSTAAEIAGERRITRALPQLLERLNDPSREVRARVAEALGEIVKNRPVPQKLLVALRDSDELVRVNTAEALSMVGDRRARPFLLRALADRSSLVRRYAAQALGKVGQTRDKARLRRRLLHERSQSARLGLFVALYQLGDRECLSSLISMLKSRQYRVRCAVANALSDVVRRQDDAVMALGMLKQARKVESTRAASSAIGSAIEALS